MKNKVPHVLRVMGAIADHVARKCDNILNNVESVEAVQKDLDVQLGQCKEDGWITKETLSTITYEHIDYLKLLGFQAWDKEDEDGNVLILFPAWLYRWLPKDVPFWSISGDKAPIGKDGDSRFGCLAYGFGFNTKGGKYTPPKDDDGLDQPTTLNGKEAKGVAIDTCCADVTCYPPQEEVDHD